MVSIYIATQGWIQDFLKEVIEVHASLRQEVGHSSPEAIGYFHSTYDGQTA